LSPGLGDPRSGGDAEARFTRRTEVPLAVAAAVFLGAYAWPILDPHLVHHVRRSCEIVVYVIWALFAVDYAIRLYLSDTRWRFVRRNVVDLLSIVLPVLRPLRLLRLIALIRVLNRRAESSLHGRVAIYVLTSGSLLVFVASVAALDAERRNPHANITTFGDALWWSATTVTTVGYGDHYPVTVEGRFVAVALMIGGIALLGIVTASIATWLLSRVREQGLSSEERLTRQLEDVQDELTELKQLVRGLRVDDSPAPS
jgi:voltage-gated potassium channel